MISDAYPNFVPSTATRYPSLQRTRGRAFVDVLFGIFLPLGCLIFDPCVFRGGLMAPAVFGHFAIVGYAAAGIGMATLLVWLLMRNPSALFSGLMAGLLGGGAVFALCLGIVMLPISLIGLVIAIGVLGFIPFFTAGVFWRNARFAWVSARTRRNPDECRVVLVIGLLVACGGPWLAHFQVESEFERAVIQITSDDPIEQERGVSRCQWLRLMPDDYVDRLVWEYMRESDPMKQEGLARAYSEMTGRAIESRMIVLRD